MGSFFSWDADPGDENLEYFLRTQLLYPDHTQFGDISKIRIDVKPEKRSQVSVQFLAFPIGQIGFYTVRTWVEENQKTVVEPLEFKIELEIVRQKQIPKAP